MAKTNRSKIPAERLSSSEWQLMQICWRLGRCNARDVLRENLKTHIRDYRTILTFLTRMTRKGWLEVEKEGNTNYYTPAVAQSEALEARIRQFLDQVVGPDPKNRQLLLQILKDES